MRIIGHDSIICQLKDSAFKKRLNTSYIYTGPSCIGKKLAAVYLAQLLNCGASGEDKPCGGCANCRNIEKLNFPDVHHIKPEGKGGIINIDSVREMKKAASLSSYQSGYKIFIIEDAEKLTIEASNALLKVLEEAEENVIFILITHAMKWILKTIVSRSVILRFSPLSIEKTTEFLRSEYGLPQGKADFIAKYSGGRLGEAIRVKDTDLIERKNRAIDKIGALIYNYKPQSDYKTWEYPDRNSLKEDIGYFQLFFRDINILKKTGKEKSIFNSDRLNDIQKAVKGLTEEKLDHITSHLLRLESYIDYNVNTKLVVDSLIANVI